MQVFKLIDTDGSGSIDFQEFSVFFARARSPSVQGSGSLGPRIQTSQGSERSPVQGTGLWIRSSDWCCQIVVEPEVYVFREEIVFFRCRFGPRIA